MGSLLMLWKIPAQYPEFFVGVTVPIGDVTRADQHNYAGHATIRLPNPLLKDLQILQGIQQETFPDGFSIGCFPRIIPYKWDSLSQLCKLYNLKIRSPAFS